MLRILAIPGSLRARSFNAALVRAAAEAAPEDVHLEIATLHGIPLYDGDLEDAHGVPDAVARLRQRILASDGLLLATPEYNNSIPGVFTNAIDWLSRPSSDGARVFDDRPVALAGATPGPGGTVLAQAAWLPLLRALGARVWFGQRFYVSRASTVFDPAGALVDDQVRLQLRAFLAAFARFAGAAREAA